VKQRGFQRIANLVRRARRGLPPVGLTPSDVACRENKWRLLRYRARPEGLAYRTPVLLIPSLINRYYVLDLRPGRSFVEYLVARGHDVYIIDWGTPGPEDRHLSLDAICDGYIGRAVRRAARGAPGGLVHALGYCLGGTLAVIHAAARPARIASLVALAAPVDFHDGGLLSAWTRVDTFDIDALCRAFANVPWPLMQASFHLLRPTLNLAKAVTLVDKAWDDEFLDGFFAIERWGNDNVSFPSAAYRRYIQALYRDNALVRGTLRVSGLPARLDNIRCPTLAVMFEHDHIVPLASAAALLDGVGADPADVTRVQLRGGHVGAVISRNAASSLWPTLSDWWARHEVADTRR
jgi:polyhydroxyalkanoate synthase